MHILDYIVLSVILLSLLVTGFLLSKVSGKDTTEFLVAGRKMPWWLIGLSDLAVGLNTSSMLQESRKVRQDGLIGLMHTWAFAMKSCIAAIFFSRLWRRARFKTQMEFYHTRYSGWQADFARIYDTVIFGGFVTSIWAAVGLVGLKKIAVTVMGLPQTAMILGFTVQTDHIVVIVAILVALTYSAASGARGIYWTDLIEFSVAMIALYALFGVLFVEIGGSSGLRESIESMPGDGSKYLNFLQPLGIVYIALFLTNPLLDHGGFDPGMQRTLSLKDEREIIYSQIFKGVGGFVIRGLPFIGIGLISMFLIDDAYLLNNFDPLTTPHGELLPDWERVIPVLVEQYLPVGFAGLMTAAFICAFMSSFDSNIHLTGAVIVNDLYRPYLAKNKGERHYVFATKIVMIIAALLTAIIGIMGDDILYLGYLAITISLGGGWIKLLRIIWWRANGTADVAAQICAIIVFVVILSPLGTDIVVGLLDLMGTTKEAGYVVNDYFIATRNLTAALLSTAVGLTAMALTKPEPMDKLCSFYSRMRPFGFWGPIRKKLGNSVQQPDPISTQIALTVSAVAIIWGGFFASMALLLAFWKLFGACVILISVGAVGTYIFTLKLYPKGREIIEYEDPDEAASCNSPE